MMVQRMACQGLNRLVAFGRIGGFRLTVLSECAQSAHRTWCYSCAAAARQQFVAAF